MRINALIVSLAALPLMAGVAHAQDPRARATYGSERLSSGFTPDPYTVNLTAGGSIQASSVGSGCSGMIAGPPDFELTYSSGSLPLYFRTAASADTTLVVNAPNGAWYCDDDSGAEGLNAQILFTSPASGAYDVWVGTYSGGMEPATLQISELSGGGGGSSSGGQAADPSMAATYGSIRLSSGFSPDPYTVNVAAGGPNQASTISTSCVGSIARAPDFELTYTAGSLPLIFRTFSSADTSLVVNGPDGQWYCDDDGGAEGLNAELRWNSPGSGTYDVWVGSLASGNPQARLEITELGGGGGAPPVITPGPTSSLTPDASLTAAYGEITLRSGFTPDPRRIALRAGGPVPAANASAGCTGSIARAPDYQITYTAGRQPLIVRTESDTDTTLVINDPDGVWHCDDDTGGAGGNAEVNLDKPSSGVYDIWVGTFGGGTAAATLILTERP